MTAPADHISIPQPFIELHFDQYQLAAKLGISDPELWRQHAIGMIPAGVPLLASIGQSRMVWPRSDIESWIEAGKPVTELYYRTMRVFAALRDSVEAEYGAPLESLAETMISRN